MKPSLRRALERFRRVALWSMAAYVGYQMVATPRTLNPIGIWYVMFAGVLIIAVADLPLVERGHSGRLVLLRSAVFVFLFGYLLAAIFGPMFIEGVRGIFS